MKNDIMKWGLFGGVAALTIGLVLRLINTVDSMIPGVEVNLQSISVSGQVSGVINTGLSKYVQLLFNMVDQSVFTPAGWMLTFVGGEAIAVVGYYALDALKLYEGSRLRRITTVLVAGSVLTTALVSLSLTVPALPVFVTLVVDSLVLAWIGTTLDKDGVIVPK